MTKKTKSKTQKKSTSQGGYRRPHHPRPRRHPRRTNVWVCNIL